jgi:hypothetical protein
LAGRQAAGRQSGDDSGVIDTLTNHVEPPRLVAQRLETFARIVARRNVIGAPTVLRDIRRLVGL